MSMFVLTAQEVTISIGYLENCPRDYSRGFSGCLKFIKKVMHTLKVLTYVLLNISFTFFKQQCLMNQSYQIGIFFYFQVLFMQQQSSKWWVDTLYCILPCPHFCMIFLSKFPYSQIFPKLSLISTLREATEMKSSHIFEYTTATPVLTGDKEGQHCPLVVEGARTHQKKLSVVRKRRCHFSRQLSSHIPQESYNKLHWQTGLCNQKHV